MRRRPFAAALLCALVALGVAALPIGLPAGPGAPVAVRAACGIPQPLELAIPSGEVVFVGTVIASENSGRWVRMRVEERWYGADTLAEEVNVHGGPEAGTVTGTDRTYLPDTRYLVVADTSAGPPWLTDSACTATQAWSEALAAYRPRGVEPAPAPEVPSTESPLIPTAAYPVIALVSLLAIVLVAYRFILVARRRPPDWMR